VSEDQFALGAIGFNIGTSGNLIHGKSFVWHEGLSYHIPAVCGRLCRGRTTENTENTEVFLRVLCVLRGYAGPYVQSFCDNEDINLRISSRFSRME
jgi:hypothetical protein